MKPKASSTSASFWLRPLSRDDLYRFLVQALPPPPSLFLSLSLFLSPPQPTKKNSATIAWREEYNPDEITFDDIKALNTGRLELSKDRDVDGRPLVFFRLR